MSNLYNEINWAIKIDDTEKFIGLGGDHLPLDFDIEVAKGVFYKPIIVAAVTGKTDCLNVMIKNKNCAFDMAEEKTGTNAFWLSAFYGQADSLRILANAGANIFLKHKKT